MTRTDTAGALQAMVSHHDALAESVTRGVSAITAAVEAGSGHERAVAELVAFVDEEVLPHVVAEERSIYRAAASNGLADTVAGMVDEHRQLLDRLGALATAVDARAAASEAEALRTLFVAHVTKENELVLPPLAADDGVDLGALLEEMHGLTEAARADSGPGRKGAEPDTDGALLRLLLEATGDLAEGGTGDRACRLAAEAWAAVRISRPDLAVRVTANLHRLVRAVATEPVAFSAGSPRRGADAEGDAALDVRALAPAQRHEKIFATYGALGAGTGFVLVNDHDPKPLRYQFQAEHSDEFTWDVLEAGPEVWRVRIGRPATSGSSAAGGPGRAQPELDVRRFPHGQRHDVIFTTFDALADGAGFVLVNDHDPKPLRYQFEAQHQGSYTWDYLESGPEVWRVRIGRLGAKAS